MILGAFLLYLLFSYPVQSAKVVTIPFPATSYVKSSHLVSRELQKFGHNVTLVLPGYISNSDRFNFTDVHRIVIEWYDKQEEDKFDQLIMSGITDNIINHAINSFYFIDELADTILSDDDLLKQLARENFDFVILGGADEFRFLANFPKKLSLPFAVLGTGYDLWSQSSPFMPSFTPSIMSTLTDRMTFTERLFNTVLTVVSNGFSWMSRVYFNNKYGIPPHKPVVASAEIWILETEPVLDYSAPAMPYLKMIGGLSVEKAKTLPIDLESFMDRSKGVIYMSFGSLSRGIIQENEKKIFLDVFLSLPYHVVWKTEVKLNKGRFFTKPWLPQNDILGHHKTKLFISHCGRKSQYESVYHAVPLLCIPLHDDQFYNSARAEYKGFGKTVYFQDLKVTDLKNTIEELITNKSYIESVTRGSNILKSPGKLPSERAAYWIDHVIKFGGSYMRSGGQELMWYQFLVLDVIGILIIVGIIMFLLFRNFGLNIVERYTTRKAMNGTVDANNKKNQ